MTGREDREQYSDLEERYDRLHEILEELVEQIECADHLGDIDLDDAKTFLKWVD